MWICSVTMNGRCKLSEPDWATPPKQIPRGDTFYLAGGVCKHHPKDCGNYLSPSQQAELVKDFKPSGVRINADGTTKVITKKGKKNKPAQSEMF